MKNEIQRKVGCARIFGNIAFARGMKAAPALDKNLLDLLPGLQVGEGLPILNAWSAGWHECNAISARGVDE